MLLLGACSNLSTTKIARHVRPYRHIAVALLLGLLILASYLHVSTLKDDILTKLEESQGSIEDVDLDSSLYEDGSKKGVDIKFRRNPNPKQKNRDLMKKGGFAPIRKLQLPTDEPAVQIPPFFPLVEFNCRTQLKRVAGAWITHLKDPGDAQHRHRTDSWNLCFEEKLSRLNAFSPRGKGTSCVVYSFGMDMNWSFEEDMLLHNCEVHMFDGSTDRHSQKIRRKVKNLTIHRAILSDKNIKKLSFLDEKERLAQNVPPDQKTLGSLMEELGHDRIDVLKLDIEGHELDALEKSGQTLINGVDQLLLEVHMHISEHAHDSAKPEHFEQETIDKWKRLFDSLHNDGYRVYDIRAKGTDRDGNIIPQHHYSCCYRLAMIKTPYKKKDSIDELSLDV